MGELFVKQCEWMAFTIFCTSPKVDNELSLSSRKTFFKHLTTYSVDLRFVKRNSIWYYSARLNFLFRNCCCPMTWGFVMVSDIWTNPETPCEFLISPFLGPSLKPTFMDQLCILHLGPQWPPQMAQLKKDDLISQNPFRPPSSSFKWNMTLALKRENTLDSHSALGTGRDCVCGLLGGICYTSGCCQIQIFPFASVSSKGSSDYFTNKTVSQVWYCSFNIFILDTKWCAFVPFKSVVCNDYNAL